MEERQSVKDILREEQVFNRLTEEQKKAVFAKIGSVCINSGAGTGKTHVLVNRMYHLIGNENIDPRRILAVAYTNKAVAEIRKRVSEEIGLSDEETQNIRTFHSFFLEILREHIARIDKKFEGFQTLSGENREMILNDMCEEFEIGENKEQIPSIISALKRAKNLEEKLLELSDKFGIDAEKIRMCYMKYVKVLENWKLIDFDDYEVLVNLLLDKDEDVRNLLANKFDAICIDEFQDISLEQLEIIKKITTPDSNIFVVGDPDQSIYGFRDISPNSLFEEFLNHYKDASVINLEQNFRSTKHILNMANISMEKHPKHEKLYKKLWTNHDEGERVIYRKFRDSKQEMDWVIKEIERISKEEQIIPEEIAILCRNNLPQKLQDNFYHELRKKGFDVNCTNTKNSFLALREIQFVVAALNIAFLESVAYKHIYPFLSAFWFEQMLDPKEVRKFCIWATENNYSFTEAINRIKESQIGSNEMNILEKIGREIIDKKQLFSELQIDEVVLQLTNYDGSFKNKIFRNHNNKAVKKVWAFVKHLKRNQFNMTTEELIRTIPFMNFNNDFQQNKTEEEPETGITISTIHKAKGLEFEHVFLIGVCAKYFPNPFKSTDKNEERRVAHVAYTRAKKRLVITCPTQEPEGESEFIDYDLRQSPSLIFVD